MATLLDLAGQRYDRVTFWNVLGKDRVMQSWLWQLGRDEGEARALRLVCADLAKELHPRMAARVLSAIESCDRLETLHAWILQCRKLSGSEFAGLDRRAARSGEPLAHEPAFAQGGPAGACSRAPMSPQDVQAVNDSITPAESRAQFKT